ncbi:transmembrane and coiled-coil domain-containing protein 6 [Colletes latitarsis]|uniref:transmembrane and coiled-coil domain-containing protein 6 n=1 Tax=Colletes latitarsis TaxID=2605962 RepID=UPI0040352571
MEVDDSKRNDVVEIMRENLRELANVERKEYRTKVLNKNRVALGNIVPVSFLTTKFVVEKAKVLKKKPLSIEEYKQLQNALIQSEDHVNSFLKVDNILHALVRDFSSNDPALQLSAISCCCNIALGNVKACTSLAKSIAPYLITELDSLNYPLLDVCVWTLGNLVAGSDKAFEILHAQDCFKYIVSLMNNCDDTIFPSVAYTAMQYMHVGFQRIPENKIIELAKAITGRNLSFENRYFVWLLALLSSQMVCNIYLHRTVPSIVDYLYQNSINNVANVTEITACIRILANIICEPSGDLAKLFLENPKYTRSDLEISLNKLLSCQYIHVRNETLWLIGNLYNHNCTDVKMIIQDIVPRLSSLKQAVLSTTQQTMSISTDLID